MGGATLFLAAAMAVWLLKGHPSATMLVDASGWRVVLGPQGNLALLGSATLALLGSDMPLSLTGETKTRKSIPRHLVWGTLLTLGGYIVFTFGVLVIQGAGVAQQTINPMVLLIGTIDRVFGSAMGGVMAFCLLLYFMMIPVALNVCFSRLLVVSALHQQISMRLAQVTRHRVPATALGTQVVFGLLATALIYMVVPLFNLKQSADLSNIMYNVLGAGLLLVWIISFLFPFLLLAILAGRQGKAFRRTCVIPFPILVISMITGPLLCMLTFVTTLTNSFIPSLLPNATWGWIVGAVASGSLIIAAICSMLSNSEAKWEALQEQQAEMLARPNVPATLEAQHQSKGF
ncbi:hypothetical protein KSX_73640 [Ktedonospora formicarum]|uniref:Uncharacterized protein n=2 Tax=Ktedonospora formicarum TaxID=2778364 RepID=A0A8J3I839_9CHLR|nr:hypothetical protein KSX_73640 [Ktedonospora formicarum]